MAYMAYPVTAESLGVGHQALSSRREAGMTIGTLLVIILIVLLIGALPRWGHSRRWGYGPSGGLGLVLVILLILVLMGRL